MDEMSEERELSGADVPLDVPALDRGPGSGLRHPPFTAADAKEYGARGGKASAEARRRKCAAREAAEGLLSSCLRDKELTKELREAGFRFGADGRAIYPTAAEAIMARQIIKALTVDDHEEARKALKLLLDAASGRIGRPIEEEEEARLAAKMAGTGKDEEPAVGFEGF